MRKKLGSYLKLIMMIKYYGMNRYGRSSMLLLSKICLRTDKRTQHSRYY